MSIFQTVPAASTKVSVVLIAPSDERRRGLAHTISGTQARVVREYSAYPNEEALSKLVNSDCDVIMVDLDTGVGPGIELIGSICRRNVMVTVMACSSGHDAEVVIRSMRAGAREFLAEPLMPATAEEAFMRASARKQTVSLNRKAGKLMVFQGAKGGVGVTTLATNFAVAIAKEDAGGVVLVDLHPQLGEVALSLGIVPKFSITHALENSTRLDWDFLSTLLTKHQSGLMVLSSADEYGIHRSLEHGTEKLLRILQEEFAFVVVDTASCSGSTPDALFEMADIVYVVSEVSLPALRNARRLITHFEAKGTPIEVILNRFNSRKVEIDEESATKALSRAVNWKIPNDYAGVRGAQNLGRPLVMQDTAIARAMCQMAKGACAKFGAPSAPNEDAVLKGDKWRFWASKSTRPLSTAHS
jgi:pilus assembly protein CpaE